MKRGNLDWFWKPWFFEFGYPDLKVNIGKVDNATGASFYVAYVEREGLLPVPVKLEVEYQDGSKEMFLRNMEPWKNTAQRVMQIPLDRNKVPVKAVLGGKTIPDARPKDNVWNAPN